MHSKSYARLFAFNNAIESAPEARRKVQVNAFRTHAASRVAATAGARKCVYTRLHCTAARVSMGLSIICMHTYTQTHMPAVALVYYDEFPLGSANRGE